MSNDDNKMIRVEVINTFLFNSGKEFVILLRGTGDEKRTLPISIGHLEAQSIALKLNNIPFPRPLTHDLFKMFVEKINGTVLKSSICELKDDTFFATVEFRIGKETFSIDARPSDAIALALRFDAPVFVAEKILDEAGVEIPETTQFNEGDKISLGGEKERSAEPGAIELLRQQLENAVSEERYEEAARIRDEINKLTKIN